MTDPALDAAAQSSRQGRRLPSPGCSVVVAILAIAIVFVLVFGIRIQRQLSWIRSVEARGGSVTTDYDGPDWLAKTITATLGEDNLEGFSQVTVVDLIDCDTTAADYSVMESHSSLGSIHLGYTQTTDADLEKLSRLTSLNWRHLDGTLITD
jgi:hypothetical protein